MILLAISYAFNVMSFAKIVRVPLKMIVFNVHLLINYYKKTTLVKLLTLVLMESIWIQRQAYARNAI